MAPLDLFILLLNPIQNFKKHLRFWCLKSVHQQTFTNLVHPFKIENVVLAKMVPLSMYIYARVVAIVSDTPK